MGARRDVRMCALGNDFADCRLLINFYYSSLTDRPLSCLANTATIRPNVLPIFRQISPTNACFAFLLYFPRFPFLHRLHSPSPSFFCHAFLFLSCVSLLSCFFLFLSRLYLFLAGPDIPREPYSPQRISNTWPNKGWSHSQIWFIKWAAQEKSTYYDVWLWWVSRHCLLINPSNHNYIVAVAHFFMAALCFINNEFICLDILLILDHMMAYHSHIWGY